MRGRLDRRGGERRRDHERRAPSMIGGKAPTKIGIIDAGAQPGPGAPGPGPATAPRHGRADALPGREPRHHGLRSTEHHQRALACAYRHRVPSTTPKIPTTASTRPSSTKPPRTFASSSRLRICLRLASRSRRSSRCTRQAADDKRRPPVRFSSSGISSLSFVRRCSRARVPCLRHTRQPRTACRRSMTRPMIEASHHRRGTPTKLHAGRTRSTVPIRLPMDRGSASRTPAIARRAPSPVRLPGPIVVHDDRPQLTRICGVLEASFSVTRSFLREHGLRFSPSTTNVLGAEVKHRAANSSRWRGWPVRGSRRRDRAASGRMRTAALAACSSAGRVHARHQHAVSTPTGIDRGDPLKPAHERHRAYQDDQREGDFGHDESLAETLRSAASRHALRRLLQHVVDVGPRREPRGHSAEDQTGRAPHFANAKASVRVPGLCEHGADPRTVGWR